MQDAASLVHTPQRSPASGTLCGIMCPLPHLFKKHQRMQTPPASGEQLSQQLTFLSTASQHGLDLKELKRRRRQLQLLSLSMEQQREYSISNPQQCGEGKVNISFPCHSVKENLAVRRSCGGYGAPNISNIKKPTGLLQPPLVFNIHIAAFQPCTGKLVLCPKKKNLTHPKKTDVTVETKPLHEKQNLRAYDLLGYSRKVNE